MNLAEPSGNRPFELEMPMQSVPSAEPQTKTPLNHHPKKPIPWKHTHRRNPFRIPTELFLPFAL